jgi:hypothetical protein
MPEINRYRPGFFGIFSAVSLGVAMTPPQEEIGKMLKRVTGWSALVALTAALVTMPAATANAQGNQNRNRMVVPVSGAARAVGTDQIAGAVAGNYAISRFEVKDGQLFAVGTVTGTVTDPAGSVVRTFVQQVTVPVMNAGGAALTAAAAPAAAAIGSCDILNLVLGPLHLDLLGLVIDLNQVVLNITGTTGAGDLLGNLLCSITGLLDAGSLGQQLVNLLNQLIGVLGTL